MYRIYYDSQILWSPELPRDEYGIWDQKLSMEIGTAGSLEFKMPPTHVAYSAVKKLANHIYVKQTDDGSTETVIWKGRVLSDDCNVNKVKSVYCEGELAFLNDSLIMPYTQTGFTVSSFLKKIIAEHNSRVGTRHQLQLSVDLSVPSDTRRKKVGTATESTTFDIDQGSYSTALAEINSDIIRDYAGYLFAENGTVYYSSYDRGIGDQVIQFGSNIIDYEDKVDGSEMFTCLVPFGANDLGITSDYYLTDSSGNKVYYLRADSVISDYGLIWKTKTWSDISDADELKTTAQAYLNDHSVFSEVITANAVDLHLKNVDVPALRLGYSYRILSVPHGIDTYLPLSKIDIKLANPEQSTYTFGSVDNDQITSTLNSVKADYTKSASSSSGFAVVCYIGKHITAQRPASTIKQGGSLSMPYSVQDGYTVVKSVTMGGVSQTTGNPIVINSVTGNVSINLDYKLSTIALSSIPSYWQSEVTDAIDYANDLDGYYNYLCITDIHYTYNKRHSALMCNYMMQNGPFRKLLILGDITTDHETTSGDDYMTLIADCLDGLDGQILLCSGNHDDKLEKATLYKDFMSKISVTWADKSSNHYDYYYDDSGPKIRFIFLDFQGTYLAPIYNTDWLASAVATVPTGYSYAICLHYTYNLHGWEGCLTTAQETAINNIITANADKNIVGIFTGHQHIDHTDKLPNGAYHTTLMCDRFGYSWDYEGVPTATAGTTSEHAFTIISINPTTKNVKFHRVGTYALPQYLEWDYTYEAISKS